MIEFNAKKIVVSDEGFLMLEMTDQAGQEFQDGSIVQIKHQKDGGTRKILAYIRYAFGRFEAVAPFSDQRFIFGLHPEYLIIDHMENNPDLINDQASRIYGK